MLNKTFALFGATVLVAALATATAATLPDTQVNVTSGGATVEEFQDMNRNIGAHTLKLVLASKGSGAYIADVDVVVRALPSREVMVEHRAQGPLVLATLPPGRYEVTASYADGPRGAVETQKRIVQVGNGRTQIALYFNTGDAVSPDSLADYRTK
jgi:hypothetical protein